MYRDRRADLACSLRPDAAAHATCASCGVLTWALHAVRRLRADLHGLAPARGTEAPRCAMTLAFAGASVTVKHRVAVARHELRAGAERARVVEKLAMAIFDPGLGYLPW